MFSVVDSVLKPVVKNMSPPLSSGTWQGRGRNRGKEKVQRGAAGQLGLSVSRGVVQRLSVGGGYRLGWKAVRPRRLRACRCCSEDPPVQRAGGVESYLPKYVNDVCVMKMTGMEECCENLKRHIQGIYTCFM